MPHFRVDDGLNNHPKARQAGLEAMGLWSLCGSYCMAYLTDGFVPEWYVKSWPKGAALAKRLVTARLWYPAEVDGECGWSYHEWRQDTKAQILADREKARQRKARQRESHPQSRRDIPSDDHRDADRTPGYVPNTQTPQETYVYENGDVSNAREPRSAPVEPAANRLVREIISKKHPEAVKTELRLQASALLNQGQSEELVAESLRLWTQKQLHPKTLPSLVSELINGHEARAPALRAVVGGHDAKVNDYLAYANPQRPELEQ
jgi:hypothetical protein